MPYLSITTNAALSADSESALAAAVSKCLATELGKPEAYVMVSVQLVRTLHFAGSDAPAAFLDLRSIGLPRRLDGLATALTAIVSEHCCIPGDRIYIAAADVSAAHWAHDGGTFA